MCETENASKAAWHAGILAIVRCTTRPTPSSNRSNSRRLLLLCVAWLVCVASSFTALALYKAAPSEFGRTPLAYPSDSSVKRTPQRAAMIMFIHPRCACSRASLTELGRVMASYRGALGVDVTVMVRSEAVADEALERAPLVAQARALQGAQVRFDVAGVEAMRFAAETSGHTVLYAADGSLRFSGGLTNSRGHEGPSLGHAYLASALSEANESASKAGQQSLERRAAPVFGCGLGERKAEQ
jgi:hypothetical protein